MTIATPNGFQIYNVSPFKLMLKRDIDGGLSFVQMLNRSNILIFVGSGENEDDYPSNKLFFWNEKEQDTIDEIEMDSTIISAKINNHM